MPNPQYSALNTVQDPGETAKSDESTESVPTSKMGGWGKERAERTVTILCMDGPGRAEFNEIQLPGGRSEGAPETPFRFRGAEKKRTRQRSRATSLPNIAHATLSPGPMSQRRVRYEKGNWKSKKKKKKKFWGGGCRVGKTRKKRERK